MAVAKGALVAAVVALAEGLTPFGLDNLLLPVLASGLLAVLV